MGERGKEGGREDLGEIVRGQDTYLRTEGYGENGHDGLQHEPEVTPSISNTNIFIQFCPPPSAFSSFPLSAASTSLIQDLTLSSALSTCPRLFSALIVAGGPSLAGSIHAAASPGAAHHNCVSASVTFFACCLEWRSWCCAARKVMYLISSLPSTVQTLQDHASELPAKCVKYWAWVNFVAFEDHDIVWCLNLIKASSGLLRLPYQCCIVNY